MSAKSDPKAAILAYIREVQHNLSSGIAKEHTHRHALEDLVEALDPTVDAFNDPKHIAVGAPDFTIRRKGQATDFSVGWIETKDIGDDLNKVEKSEQLERYLRLSNFILTDYLEFRWYTDGERRLTARLATVGKGHKLIRNPKGEDEVIALLEEFLRHTLTEIADPRDLAKRMADLAHFVRDILLRTFETEGGSGHLHNQFQAFQQSLIPDLKPDQFADMYAQTIVYGLFAARCQPGVTRKNFSRASAADLIPRTNPFLRRLFHSIAFELDDRVLAFVNDLVALLRDADIHTIMHDFGKRTAREDPVVHFYEDFLKEYDPKVREMRGVYYTPEPVVSYIVRSVDHLLKTRFDKPMGLADKDVLILDPACGTGTFLYYVIQHIHNTLKEHGQLGHWKSYVSENLLKRVFGFELLMAPYAVAHLKLGLLLQELGYKFDSDQRLGIYLTNTLEEAAKKSELLFAQYIADEANAASAIKRDLPIMVVLGNPPYSVSSANQGEWIMKLLETYKQTIRDEETQIQAVSDDYVKFIRFAHWRIERTGSGIVGMISNNGYVDGVLFRDMRKALMDSFSRIFVLDLHGSARKKERAPDGSKDENVFDIQQGTAIALLEKSGDKKDSGGVHKSDLWGTRSSKYDCLMSSDMTSFPWERIQPSAPLFQFTYLSKALEEEYSQGFLIPQIFRRYGAGFATRHDKFAIGFTDEEVLERAGLLADETNSEHELRDRFRLCKTVHFSFDAARKALQEVRVEQYLTDCMYRPFDRRKMIFLREVIAEPRIEIMRHLHNRPVKNLALAVSRIVNAETPRHAFVSRLPIEKICLSARTSNNAHVFPLYLYQDQTSAQRELGEVATRNANLHPEFIETVSRRLGLRHERDGWGDLQDSFGPEDILAYVYTILHSPSYRVRYMQFLRSDFARIPLTSDKELFRALVEKGRELVSLHLMESPKLAQFITRYEQQGDHVVEKVRYSDVQRRVHINKTQYVEGVPKDVWEFHIGGYQVCEKWLKDRKGRKLSSDDIDHYQKIVVAISETIRLMREIDEIIPGWPLP